jgi:hypothetical protein
MVPPLTYSQPLGFKFTVWHIACCVTKSDGGGKFTVWHIVCRVTYGSRIESERWL